jgi:phosphohistidine phosphatase
MGNTKRLLLLRHAKSSWSEERLPDHERPLNERGRRDAPRVGKRLQATRRMPDLIVSSTAKRARKTARLVAAELKSDPAILLYPELYAAPRTSFFQVLAQLPSDPDTLLVVGHNPGISSFASLLCGEDLEMPTACLLEIDLGDQRWEKLARRKASGRLVEMWSP